MLARHLDSADGYDPQTANGVFSHGFGNRAKWLGHLRFQRRRALRADHRSSPGYPRGNTVLDSSVDMLPDERRNVRQDRAHRVSLRGDAADQTAIALCCSHSTGNGFVSLANPSSTGRRP